MVRDSSSCLSSAKVLPWGRFRTPFPPPPSFEGGPGQQGGQSPILFPLHIGRIGRGGELLPCPISLPSPRMYREIPPTAQKKRSPPYLFLLFSSSGCFWCAARSSFLPCVRIGMPRRPCPRTTACISLFLSQLGVTYLKRKKSVAGKRSGREIA